MNVKFYLILFCIIVAVVVFLGRQSKGEDPQAEKITFVRAEDIPEKVKIVGLLGVTLGEAVTIRGQWIYPGDLVKDNSLRFIVTHVNGKELPKKVEWNHAQITPYFLTRSKGQKPSSDGKWDWKYDFEGKEDPPKPKRDEHWELRGAECGVFDSYASELGKETGAPVQSAYYSKFFYTRFEYIAVKKLGTVTKAPAKNNS